MKDDIKAAIEAKKALMAAELKSTEKHKGYLIPSYCGGARNAFEELSNIKAKVSGKKYASDALVSKYGRS